MKILWKKQIGSVTLRAYEDDEFISIDGTLIINARQMVSLAEWDNFRSDIEQEMAQIVLALLKSGVDKLYNEMHS